MLLYSGTSSVIDTRKFMFIYLIQTLQISGEGGQNIHNTPTWVATHPAYSDTCQSKDCPLSGIITKKA